MRTPSIRAATLSDVDCLLALETDSFASDRLTSRSFRHFVRSPTAVLRVMREGTGILGYYLMLFRARSEVARLYSIAVDGRHRGRGLAAALLADAERAARRQGLRPAQPRGARGQRTGDQALRAPRLRPQGTPRRLLRGRRRCAPL